ncbi:MAG: damage repair protein, partial [Candidatus Enteromonas sp.]|nr:damage repair protein [Candidatus Enteromonas sp.]
MVKEDLYCVIDLKSFYASCECVARGLDIFKTPLVVCDPDRSMSTIVMSSTPYLKDKYHIPNVCRRRDLPNVENLILAQPRMAYYIEMSAKVVSIFLDYVSEEDLHVYSIDESFLHISPYLSLAKQTPEEFVAEIQKRIKKELGLTATAGIGPNMFLAKVCLDNEGKKKAPYIGRWRMEDVPTKLWSITPITKIWGISN